MGFMIGRAPIRRTLKYLTAGKLALKDNVKIFAINYNTFGGDHHAGARDYVFWKIPQVQYRNPGVQVVTLKNMTPTPFIRCYFGKWLDPIIFTVPALEITNMTLSVCVANGEEMLIDIDSKTKEEIEKHLIAVVGKSEYVTGLITVLCRSRSNG